MRRPRSPRPRPPCPGSAHGTHLRWAPGAPLPASHRRTSISCSSNSSSRFTANPAGSNSSERQCRRQGQERCGPRRNGGLLSSAALAAWRGMSAARPAIRLNPGKGTHLGSCNTLHSSTVMLDPHRIIKRSQQIPFLCVLSFCMRKLPQFSTFGAYF